MFKYTFQEADSGKNFNLTFTHSSQKTEHTLTTTLKVSCKKIESGKDPIAPANPTGSFPDGQSDEYFSILYHIKENMYQGEEQLNILNTAAATYMDYVDKTVSHENLKYYGMDDDKRIYVLIPKADAQGKLNYKNTSMTVDGKDCYKIYVQGWCEIVDIGNLGGSTIELNMANGYYYNIDNTLYLFINTKLNLVSFNEDYSQYWYKETPHIKETISSNDIYLSDGHYLKYSNDGAPTSLNEENEDTMMISGGVITQITTPSMLTSISNFCSTPNITKIILSNYLVDIGDYAFYGCSLHGDVIFLNQGGVKTIGKYAFANTGNMDLFLQNNIMKLPSSLISIDEGAFMNASMGHSGGIDISNCVNLKYIGKIAFGSISNYKYFIYRKNQVEEDGLSGTQLIYLPPCHMAYAAAAGHNLKDVGEYLLSQDPSSLYTSAQAISDYDDLIEEGHIDEIEKTNGMIFKTFDNASLSGFTWKCVE